MIPKVIHYCWFGGKPLPESALRCIASWQKYCPGYEIKRWDESNYDVNCCDYVCEAYAAKKWAFVSDYARFDILYRHGGLYFDTDVELIAPIDDILEKGPFLGVEQNAEEAALVNPGLGMAAVTGMPIYGKMLEDYRKLRFLMEDGTYNQTTIVKYTTDLLTQYGLQNIQQPQLVAEIWIYPWDYFCPVMYQTGEATFTENTRSIHHYDASWLSEKELRIHQMEVNACKWFGPKIGRMSARVWSFPYRCANRIRQEGLAATLCYAVEKLRNK